MAQPAVGRHVREADFRPDDETSPIAILMTLLLTGDIASIFPRTCKLFLLIEARTREEQMSRICEDFIGARVPSGTTTMSISGTPSNTLPLALSMEILSGVWIPPTPLAVWMDLAPPLSKYGEPRILVDGPRCPRTGVPQAANSLQDDGRLIGFIAPSGVPMQDALSGQLADLDPHRRAAALMTLSPMSPRSCYVPGLAHDLVELKSPPARSGIMGIGAHLAIDNAPLARSTTTGESGLLPGLPRAYPINVLAQRGAISLAFFGVWFLVCVLGLLTTSKRTWLAKIGFSISLLTSFQCCGDVYALRPMMLRFPLAYQLAAPSGHIDNRTAALERDKDHVLEYTPSSYSEIDEP
ncbi:hypothetical protein C8R44DRAFT_752603 [Mycena epipterygia]|nr:hypothetical protein C8R44DRAFT_752603 [Mycena epipterygia]